MLEEGKKLWEGSGIKNWIQGFMCQLSRSPESDRQMEEAHLWDVCVGQNVLKINAATDDTESFRAELHEPSGHYPWQGTTAQHQSTRPAQEGASLRDLPLSTGKVGPQPQVRRQGCNSFLHKCLDDPQKEVHFHRSQIFTAIPRHCYRTASIKTEWGLTVYS